MKNITKENLVEIMLTVGEKGFLNREEVAFLRKKFSFSYETFKRELLSNKIPFISSNLKNLFESYGLHVENKTINLHDFCKLGEWKNEVFKNSKINIKFICEKCNKDATTRVSKSLGREFFRLQPICPKCINNCVKATEECRIRNSNAQLISQNKPETKEKNRQSQLKRLDNQDIKQRYSDIGKQRWKNEDYRNKMCGIAKRKWDDPEYARKVIENSKNGGLKGIYKNTYYDSGYELAWLMKMDSEGQLCNIRRANLYINYVNYSGKKSHYYPDFILNETFLVEVKGYGPWADIKNIELKNSAAKEWCKENCLKFRLVELKDIGSIWYRNALKQHKEIKNGKAKE